MSLRPLLLSLAMLLVPLFARADWTGAEGRVSVKSEAFLSPDYTATEQRQFNIVAAGLRTSGLGPGQKTERFETGLQASIDGEVSPQTPALSYLNIRQLYHQESLLSVGRKKEIWSDLDERWNLGMYQPVFRWNPLTPESQGLTGLFLHLRGDQDERPWGVRMFGTALSIPDQGPGYRIQDGQFQASNPWFYQAPRQAEFEGTGATDEIHYELIEPETNKIIFNSGFASQFYWGESREGFQFLAGYAYKPSNQLALAVDGEATAQNRVDVRITPAIYYHQILSADASYRNSLFESGLGVLNEKPQAPQFDSKWTFNTYRESTLISPYVGTTLGFVRLRAMALSVQGGESQTQGPKKAYFEEILLPRYPFRDAGALEASARRYWRRHEGVQGKVRYTQGSQDEFALLTGDLSYQFDPRWSLSSQVALLRASAGQRDDKTLYSDYEDNDSFQVGVLYVF